MEKKYILTEETKEVGGHILHKIQAVRDFGDVQKGDLGGWIESEKNLSHDGDCWISSNGKVFDNGEVSGNGRIFGDGWVSDDGWVFGNAKIGFNAYISSPRSYFVQGPIGSRDDFLTCYLDKDKKIYAVTGCFSGTLEEFEKKVKETHGSNKHAKQYLKAAEAARVMLSED
ncbi:hypothetical protein [Hydrogeniiclostridium mannosilyticum]|uniref:hypothetical protein n=1 Tax=Hydrogeniiclostridium mannosilyticum TaxID=2764322 RepID=UPI003999C912